MNARGTALLVAVLIGLVGYLVVVELPALHRPPVPRDLPDAPPLLTVSATSVTRVEIVGTDAPPVTALRREQGWTDADGHPWPRDTVSDLVQTLGTLRPLMVIDPAPATPAEYGLGDGARRLRLTTADGTTVLALELGDRNPAWTGLYARIAGRPQVVLVGGVLRWEIEKVRDSMPRPEP